MSSGDEITQSTPLLQERTNEQPSQANKTSQATDRGSSIPRRGDVEQGFGVTLIPPDNQRALEEARATLVCCCMLLVLAVVLFAILGPYFHFWNKRNPPICHSDRNYYTSAFLSVFLGYFGYEPRQTLEERQQKILHFTFAEDAWD